MARYHFDNRFAGSQQPMSSAYKTACAVWSSTATQARRGRCVGITVGADGAPNATDCQIIWQVQRQTADGTSTAATPNPIVPADTASLQVAHVNYTAEGTYTLPVWGRPLNQRASMQWMAPDLDAAILWPATNLAGLAFMALSPTYTGNFLIVVEYEDL